MRHRDGGDDDPLREERKSRGRTARRIACPGAGVTATERDVSVRRCLPRRWRIWDLRVGQEYQGEHDAYRHGTPAHGLDVWGSVYRNMSHPEFAKSGRGAG